MTKENNQNITPIISLASKYLYAKKYRKSLKEFTKAYNIDNSNREAYIGLIGCLIQLNKHKQAREKIEEIIKINPKDPNLYTLYGTSLLKTGNLIEAVEQYRIASELDDKYWSKYNNLKNAVDVIVEYNNKKK